VALSAGRPGYTDEGRSLTMPVSADKKVGALSVRAKEALAKTAPFFEDLPKTCRMWPVR
jgi:hypothetical protein